MDKYSGKKRKRETKKEKYRLINAVRYKNLDLVKSYVNEDSIDINLRDYRAGERTALFIAVDNNEYDMVKLIISHPDLDLNIECGKPYDHCEGSLLYHCMTGDRDWETKQFVLQLCSLSN